MNLVNLHLNILSNVKNGINEYVLVSKKWVIRTSLFMWLFSTNNLLVTVNHRKFSIKPNI